LKGVINQLVIAKTISEITNPCLLSILILLLISFTKSYQLRAAYAQSITIIILFVILPLAFIFLRTASLPDKTIYRRDPTLFLKRHPLDIMILGIVCGPLSWIILKLFSAPALLLDTLTALLAVAYLIAITNLFYRISFHLAGITTLIYIAVVTWGTPLLFLSLAFPPIAWAKYKLNEHNFLQMVLGICLAIAITSLVIHLL
jgi:hypothetical protein